MPTVTPSVSAAGKISARLRQSSSCACAPGRPGRLLGHGRGLGADAACPQRLAYSQLALEIGYIAKAALVIYSQLDIGAQHGDLNTVCFFGCNRLGHQRIRHIGVAFYRGDAFFICKLHSRKAIGRNLPEQLIRVCPCRSRADGHLQ